MKRIQEAVRTHLEESCGIRTVSDRTRVRGEYPLLAVGIEETGTVLLAGGKLAEHTYQVSVTAAGDRERDTTTSLLSSLWAPLLRGVPMTQDGEKRTLHPLNICTQNDTLTFTVEVCVPIPPLSSDTPATSYNMEALHMGVSE